MHVFPLYTYVDELQSNFAIGNDKISFVKEYIWFMAKIYYLTTGRNIVKGLSTHIVTVKKGLNWKEAVEIFMIQFLKRRLSKVALPTTPLC